LAQWFTKVKFESLGHRKKDVAKVDGANMTWGFLATDLLGLKLCKEKECKSVGKCTHHQNSFQIHKFHADAKLKRTCGCFGEVCAAWSVRRLRSPSWQAPSSCKSATCHVWC